MSILKSNANSVVTTVDGNILVSGSNVSSAKNLAKLGSRKDFDKLLVPILTQKAAEEAKPISKFWHNLTQQLKEPGS